MMESGIEKTKNWLDTLVYTTDQYVYIWKVGNAIGTVS